MVSFEDMQTFVEVADGGGITVAARRLGLPKSIVSRRLVRLESELGVQLLARTTRGASLTEAGASFREHAARMCLEMEVAREEMAPTGELRGRLRVAVPSSLVRGILRQRSPNWPASIRSCSSMRTTATVTSIWWRKALIAGYVSVICRTRT